MRIPLSPAQCDQVVEFYSAFKAKQYSDPPAREDLDQRAPESRLWFGLAIDPYDLFQKYKAGTNQHLGGGCTSYATSFLKAANSYEPIFNSLWRRELIIGNSWLGDLTHDPIAVTKLLFSRAAQLWAQPNEPATSMYFYDPEKIWEFMDGAIECLNGSVEQKGTCTPEIQQWIVDKGNSFRLESMTVNHVNKKGKAFDMEIDGFSL